MTRNYELGPYQTEAKYRSECAGCSSIIEPGQIIYIWPENPRGKRAFCECAEADFATEKEIANES